MKKTTKADLEKENRLYAEKNRELQGRVEGLHKQVESLSARNDNALRECDMALAGMRAVDHALIQRPASGSDADRHCPACGQWACAPKEPEPEKTPLEKAFIDASGSITRIAEALSPKEGSHEYLHKYH